MRNEITRSDALAVALPSNPAIKSAATSVCLATGQR
jgi:hypothetical protein